MKKEPTEFIDRDHPVQADCANVAMSFTGRNLKTMRRELEKIIAKDPDFLEPYLMLSDLEAHRGGWIPADKWLEEAYQRALRMITDDQGNWPDQLEWGWLENRHIIRTFINKGIDLWCTRRKNEALELFRKLLRTNPGDNGGIRYYILAINMKMSYAKFEQRFDKGGYYDMSLNKWFDRNYKKFPDEFAWWDEWCEENM